MNIFIFFEYVCIFEIVEVFPNTIDDKNLEYITVKNTSEEVQSFSGYILADKLKEYQVVEDLFLESGEEKKFLRTETKLVLNNSNEELKIISPKGDILHEIEYKSSVKGAFIRFGEPNDGDSLTNDKEILEDDTSEEGSGIISDEVVLEIMSDEAEIIPVEIKGVILKEVFDDIEEILDTPKIIFSFQRPSYIEETENDDIFICEDNRDECKVNFDLRNSFSDNFPERDYICKIDFGFGEITGQEERCNPNTIIFPKGEHEVTFKIFHEDDVTIFSQKMVKIHNIFEVENEYKGQESAGKAAIPSEAEVLEIQEIFEIPDLTIGLQIPSYIEYSQDHDVHICDGGRDECKVNFDLRSSFSDDFPERDYICEIDFGFGEITEQEERCNPNTIIFPKGEYSVTFRIFHEDNMNIFSQKIIQVQNINKDDSQVGLSNEGGAISVQAQDSIIHIDEEDLGTIHINTPKIIVQSGLKGTARYYQCLKERCKINLNYEKQHSNERCLWSFGEGVTSSSKTRERCNPGYVSYGKGVHELSLKVYENGNKNNKEKYVFYVYNDGVTLNDIESDVEYIIGDKIETKENISGRMSEGVFQETKIVLQGKIGKEKKIINEYRLECWGVEKCFVNLNGENIGNTKNLNFVWKLNGKLFSEKQNPAGIWVDEGENFLSLEVLRDGEKIEESLYFVGVRSDKNNEIGENIENNSEQNRDDSTGTNQKNINTTQVDYSKIFTQNFLVLKYDGLRISGKSPIGSQIEIYLDKEMILRGEVDEKGKYRLVSSNFIPGNYEFDTRIILENGEEIFIEDSGSFEVIEEKIQDWITDEEVEAKKVKANLKKIFTQNFLVLKYDGLRISGKAPVGSRVEIYLNGKNILSGSGDEKGKYRIVSKALQAGKYSFDTKIIFSNGEMLYIENSGEFEVLSSKIGNWFTQKTSSSSSSSKSSFKFPSLILEANAYSDFVSESPENLSIFRKILFLVGLGFLLLIAFMSAILKNIPQTKTFILESQKLSFGVRQKICLLV
ncbi:hypothetical protein N9J72_00675 [Candidatus Gracilibacteria bacterium]|nr:hypothetical protein [Candidatus Gracilibacteria bacterium]